MINSQLFNYQGTRKYHTFKEIYFFNTGLLTGQSKLTGRTEIRTMPIDAQWNSIITGSIQPIRALRRFVHYNKETIKLYTHKGEYNLVIPRCHGGVGLTPPVGYKFNITAFQQRIATLVNNQRDEQIKKGESPHGIALGIIRVAEEEVLKYFHFHVLQRIQTFGPLNAGWSEGVTKTDVKKSLLSFGYDPIIEERFRPIKGLNAIRKNLVDKMSYKHMQEEFRFIEFNQYYDHSVEPLSDIIEVEECEE